MLLSPSADLENAGLFGLFGLDLTGLLTGEVDLYMANAECSPSLEEEAGDDDLGGGLLTSYDRMLFVLALLEPKKEPAAAPMWDRTKPPSGASFKLKAS